MKKLGHAIKKINRRYNYWQALYMCWFNDKLFIDIANTWRGFAMGYLLLAIVVITSPLCIKLEYYFLNQYQKYFIDAFIKMPKLYITHGLMSCDKPMPYFIKDKENNPIIIIDATDTIQTFAQHYNKALMLIKRDQLLYHNVSDIMTTTNADNKIYTWTFDKNLNQIFDGKIWIKTFNIISLKWLIAITIYLCIIALCFSILIGVFFAIALMVQFLTKLFVNFHLTYKQTVRLLCVTTTPALTCFVVYILLNNKILWFGWILLLITAIYFNFAVYVIKNESKKLIIHN